MSIKWVGVVACVIVVLDCLLGMLGNEPFLFITGDAATFIWIVLATGWSINTWLMIKWSPAHD